MTGGREMDKVFLLLFIHKKKALAFLSLVSFFSASNANSVNNDQEAAKHARN